MSFLSGSADRRFTRELNERKKKRKKINRVDFICREAVWTVKLQERICRENTRPSRVKVESCANLYSEPLYLTVSNYSFISRYFSYVSLSYQILHVTIRHLKKNNIPNILYKLYIYIYMYMFIDLHEVIDCKIVHFLSEDFYGNFISTVRYRCVCIKKNSVLYQHFC